MRIDVPNRSFPFLVFEEVKDSFYNEKLNKMGVGYKGDVSLKLNKKRWKHVAIFHIVVPPVTKQNDNEKFQYYMVKTGYVPHYQVSSNEKNSYLNELGSLDAKIIVYDSIQPIIQNDFMIVINDMIMNQTLLKLKDSFQYQRVKELVFSYKEDNKTDAGRGNIFFDRGLCGGENQPRHGHLYGLSGPAIKTVRNGSTGEEISKADEDYCNVIEEHLRDIMMVYTPRCYEYQKELLYKIPPETKVILQEKIHPANRWGYTDSVDVVLGCHIDTQNGRKQKDLLHSELNEAVACFSNFTLDGRVSLIAYHRNSVVKAAQRYSRYHEVIKDIVTFYSEQDDNKKEITPSLVMELNKKIKSIGSGVIRQEPHLNKMFFYSPFIHMILEIINLHSLDITRVICLLYTSILSESPDTYMKVIAN